MQTYFIKSHAYCPKRDEWDGLTSCTTAENAAKAEEIVVRHLKATYYTVVAVVNVEES